MARSLALIADSVHLLTDAGALGLAFFASWFAVQPSPRKMSYGFHRVEILAALVNGVALVTLSIFIVKEALVRLSSPLAVRSPWMMAVGLAGLLFNLSIALYIGRFARGNLNVRSAFYHVIADALGSAGVIAAGLIIWKTGWIYADPLVSIVIAGLIVWGAWLILRDVGEVLLEAVPRRLDLSRLESRLLALAGVEEICDLHVWTISSGKEALSAHLGVKDEADTDLLLKEVNQVLSQEFGIHHTTIQLEKAHEKPHKPHEKF